MIGASRPLSVSYIEIGLGLRACEAECLTAAAIDAAEIQVRQGEPVIMEWTDLRRLHQWLFDPEMGYALKEYRMLVGRDVNVQVTAPGLHPCRGGCCCRGRSWHRRSCIRAIGFSKRRCAPITVKEYAVRPQQGDPESFHITWPKGAHVFWTHRPGGVHNDSALPLHRLTHSL